MSNPPHITPLSKADQALLDYALAPNTTRPKASFLLPTLALGAVVVFGLVQYVLGAHNIKDIPWGMAAFAQGKTTHALEQALDSNMPARAALIEAANAAKYKLLGGANDQVRLGKNAWIFLSEEFKHHANSANNLVAHADLLAHVSERLAQQGVRLLVALVPDKSRVYRANVCTPISTEHEERYQTMLQTLRAKGVAVTDLYAPLTQAAKTQQVYYQSDTHWNNAGAQIAAQAVARDANTLGLGLPAATFKTSVGAPAPRAGDLLRLMGLENAPAALRPPQDNEAPAETTMQNSNDGDLLGSDAGGLLGGGNSIQTVLVGTSFSKRGNFYGYLQEALGSQVLDSAKDGTGFLKSAEDYLQNEAFKTNPPKLLIWELPERFVQEPLEEKDWLKKVGL